MKRIATLTIIVLLSGPSVWGDILVVQNTGNTIVPRDEREISMDAETVRIEPTGDGVVLASEYMVSCEFVLTSHASEPITREIAFPIAYPRHDHVLAQGLRVSVKRHGWRQALKTEVKWVADVNNMSWADVAYWERPHDDFDYPGYVTWEQTFEPNETQVVWCDYPMGRPGAIFPGHPFRGSFFEYVVRTGALWKGRIGAATISLWFNPPSSAPDRITMTYPDSMEGEAAAGDVLTWRFTDWEPTEDITVAFTRWTDYDVHEIARNGYRLPHPYLGAKEAYSEQYLDRLVEREIRRVAEYYPERAQGIDKAFLRSMIAECLFYELFARHGDSFMPKVSWESDRSRYRGRQGQLLKTPMMPMIVGPWHLYFKGYGYHGGWYRCWNSETNAPNPAVELADLTARERENAAFLRKFINRPLLR
jgi:hypothetical protein